MKAFIITFGCKVNQYDSEVALTLLNKAGYGKAESIYNADIVIVNSCAVTQESVKKLKKSLNFVKKKNPNGIILLMGCVPQAFPESEGEFKNVDIFIGNSNKYNLVPIIEKFIKNRQRLVNVEKYNSGICSSLVHEFSKRTRAFIKIEDGCNRFCSYCIIPYARGRVRSKTIDNILFEVKGLADNGYKEINLVGINLSSYGLDLGTNLSDVINKISEIQGIERIRLGSLEPDLVTEKFLREISKNEKFCPQFHLSLQSGSNKILKAMHRLYTREDYINIVEKIRSMFKNATITTDLIVGFPGETENEFEESIDIIKKIKFLKIHIFPYSLRSGTVAAKMPGHIPKDIKNRRVKIAINEANNQTKLLLNNFLNKKLS